MLGLPNTTFNARRWYAIRRLFLDKQVEVTLKSGNKVKGILRNLDRKGIALFVEQEARVDVSVDDLTVGADGIVSIPRHAVADISPAQIPRRGTPELSALKIKIAAEIKAKQAKKAKENGRG